MFSGVSFIEPTYLKDNQSQFNLNCVFDKGYLKYQNYNISKKEKSLLIYKRNYIIEDIDLEHNGLNAYYKEVYYNDANGQYEYITFDLGLFKPIPKIWVDIQVNSNDKRYLAGREAFKEYLLNNYGQNLIFNIENEDYYYEAAEEVRDFEIAFSLSNDYGESGLTIYRISFYVLQLYAVIDLTDYLLTNTWINTFFLRKFKYKYLNVYIRFGYLSEWALINRIDLSNNMSGYNTITENFLGGYYESNNKSWVVIYLGYFKLKSEKQLISNNAIISYRIKASSPLYLTEQDTFISEANKNYLKDVDVISWENYWQNVRNRGEFSLYPVSIDRARVVYQIKDELGKDYWELINYSYDETGNIIQYITGKWKEDVEEGRDINYVNKILDGDKDDLIVYTDLNGNIKFYHKKQDNPDNNYFNGEILFILKKDNKFISYSVFKYEHFQAVFIASNEIAEYIKKGYKVDIWLKISNETYNNFNYYLILKNYDLQKNAEIINKLHNDYNYNVHTDKPYIAFTDGWGLKNLLPDLDASEYISTFLITLQFKNNNPELFTFHFFSFSFFDILNDLPNYNTIDNVIKNYYSFDELQLEQLKKPLIVSYGERYLQDIHLKRNKWRLNYISYKDNLSSYWEWWNDRLWLVFNIIKRYHYPESYLYYSEMGYPETILEKNLFKFNYQITGLEYLNDVLYVFTRNNIQAIKTYGVSDFILNEVYSDGAWDKSVVKYENMIFFVNSKGVYLITDRIDKISVDLDYLFQERKIEENNFDYANIKDDRFYVMKFKYKMQLDNLFSNKALNRLIIGGLSDSLLVKYIAYDLETRSWWLGNDENFWLFRTKEFGLDKNYFNLKQLKTIALEYSDGVLEFLYIKNKTKVLTYKYLQKPGYLNFENKNILNVNNLEKVNKIPKRIKVNGERVATYSFAFKGNIDTKMYYYGVIESGR